MASDLDHKIANATIPVLDHRRIQRQIIHLANAMLRDDLDQRQRDFLYASYQALQWARCPNGFSVPVRNIEDWRT
jgi:hypothetical protein